MKPLNQMPWEIQKIVEVAIGLKTTGGTTPASTGERIAAAFVLDQQEYLPEGYDMVEAWDRLDHRWQACVKLIKRDYMHLIEAG